MSEPSMQLSKLQAAQTTTELYRSCMILSEEARSLLVQNEGMKRLGLNAQVLAAQTGEQGGALEVIVSEIGRLSRSIREVLGSLGEAAKFLSHSSIEVLHLSHLHSSYVNGWNLGIDPSGSVVYSATLESVRTRRRQHRTDLEQRLRAVSSLVEDLGRIAQQIPPVTTMIRIVVTEVRIRSVELLGTVDDLKSFHAHLDTKVEHMGHIRSVCSRYIQELDREDSR
ncbi:MAG: hypothetical protein RL173_1228 [Fibrobacterota bacterium]